MDGSPTAGSPPAVGGCRGLLIHLEWAFLYALLLSKTNFTNAIKYKERTQEIHL